MVLTEQYKNKEDKSTIYQTSRQLDIPTLVEPETQPIKKLGMCLRPHDRRKTIVASCRLTRTNAFKRAPHE